MFLTNISFSQKWFFWKCFSLKKFPVQGCPTSKNPFNILISSRWIIKQIEIFGAIFILSQIIHILQVCLGKKRQLAVINITEERVSVEKIREMPASGKPWGQS